MKQVLTKSIMKNTIIFLLHQKRLNEIFLMIVNYFFVAYIQNLSIYYHRREYIERYLYNRSAGEQL